MENPTYPDAAALCKRVLDDFAEEKIGEIYLAYTHFKNTVSQEAQLIRMLPVEVSEPSEEKSSREILMNYEPTTEEALDMMEHETWLTAAQARERGMVDEIMFEEEEETVPVVAGPLFCLPEKEKMEQVKRMIRAKDDKKTELARAKLNLLRLRGKR